MLCTPLTQHQGGGLQVVTTACFRSITPEDTMKFSITLNITISAAGSVTVAGLGRLLGWW